MPSHHDIAPEYSGASNFFLDDAALPILQQLSTESDFPARRFLHNAGNERSRTGRALLGASTQWAGLLDSTAQAYSQHLHEVADFVRAAFRLDTDTEAAL